MRRRQPRYERHAARRRGLPAGAGGTAVAGGAPGRDGVRRRNVHRQTDRPQQQNREDRSVSALAKLSTFPPHTHTHVFPKKDVRKKGGEGVELVKASPSLDTCFVLFFLKIFRFIRSKNRFALDEC